MTTGARCSSDVAPPDFLDPWAVSDNFDFIANLDTYQCWEDGAMQLNGQQVQPGQLMGHILRYWRVLTRDARRQRLVTHKRRKQ